MRSKKVNTYTYTMIDELTLNKMLKLSKTFQMLKTGNMPTFDIATL